MKQKGILWMGIGLLLLSAAIFLTLYNIWDASRADREAQTAVGKLKEKIQQAAAENIYEPAEEEEETPVIEVDGYLYIGVLEIPDLDLILPVLAEWDYDRLKNAPCRFYGSCEEDNLVIAGHNYMRHFKPLKWLLTGSEVNFIDATGKVHCYEVSLTETLKPDETEQMITGDWDLTLFTCTTGGQSRFTVRCVGRQDAGKQRK